MKVRQDIPEFLTAKHLLILVNPIIVNNNNPSVQIKPDPNISTPDTPSFKKLVNIQD